MTDENKLPYDPMIQYGKTCIICGAKDYPLSMGGADICPSCDCGNTIIVGDRIYKLVGYKNKYAEVNQ